MTEPHPSDFTNPDPVDHTAGLQRAERKRGFQQWSLARRLHQLADAGSGGLIYFAVVFSPWAFGSTTDWSITVMNTAGCLLGLLLLLKYLARHPGGYAPLTWASEASSKARRWQTVGLGLLTILILTYCLISTVNARATVLSDGLRFRSHPFIAWLPNSFDRDLTWKTLVSLFSLACYFWAIRDWLLVRSRSNFEHRGSSAGAVRHHGLFMPPRLQTLIWVLSINGALLAAQGLAQRLSSNKLLWIIEPHINRTAAAQFGPYAYRSNAAQYFLLVWPLALGLWWILRRAARSSRRLKSGPNNYLLPCILLTAGAPIYSLSRAGLLIGSFAILIALLGLLSTTWRSSPWTRYATLAILSVAFVLALSVEWKRLNLRFEEASPDSGRVEIWRNTWQIVKDYPAFGTGPGTFSTVYVLYRSSATDTWFAQAHSDWLEILATFGVVGIVLLSAAFGLVVGLGFTEGGLPLHRLFVAMVWLALASCLLFAVVDFPLQIHSIRLLVILECAVLSVVTRTQSPSRSGS